MTVLQWDAVGARTFESGVDRGVLYIPNGSGVYDNGVAWNGLTTVTESPSGAEASPQYADNIKYLNLISAEQFGATVEAFTYPPEFAQFDGAVVVNGVSVGQQSRKQFGLSYRTLVGDDVSGTDKGYKLHLVYGCLAAPSERAYATINDSPEALAMSWELTTTPVSVTGLKPTAQLVIDSTKELPANMTALTNALWGTPGSAPRLPLPDEVISMFAGALTTTTPGAPTWTPGTRTVTIPATAGVVYTVNGVVRAAGNYVIAVGDYAVVNATPAAGYVFTTPSQTNWVFGPAA